MNEFLLFAVIVVYLAICYGRPNSQANSDRQIHQHERFSRAVARRRLRQLSRGYKASNHLV
jgi:hypothetical protein